MIISYVLCFNSETLAKADSIVGPYWTGSKWRDDVCLTTTGTPSFVISKSGAAINAFTILIGLGASSAALANHPNCQFVLDRDGAAGSGAFVSKTCYQGSDLPNCNFSPLHAGDNSAARMAVNLGGSLANRQAWAAVALQSGALMPAAAYVAKGLGAFICFNMATFTDAVQGLADPSQSPNTFNPASINIDAWVTASVAMKANAALLTVKHHDGFLLWPSATTTHTIAHSSPWYANSGNMDITSQYVTKFRAAGIDPNIYFSVWDRNFEINNPSYTQAQYLAIVQAQITELLTNYGTIPAIWLDGTAWHFSSVSKPDFYPWNSVAERGAFIRGLQPNIVIVDNNHTGTFGTSDILETEQTLPTLSGLCGEMCDPLRTDNSWFWLSTASSPKSSASILTNLSTCTTRNAAYALAITPDNTGVIPSDMVTTMGQIGAGH